MNPYVTSVRALDDHRLAVVFENGERRVFDIRPYLGLGVFARLKAPPVFRAARVVAGSVEWPGEVDLSYDTIYLGSRPLGADEAGEEWTG
jgi:hypothetical protein